MPFPRASQALSRFTVLDLTRVRAGPTCVRQLADWGANVIKIDALLEDAGGEQLGGPRHGADFQNLHRNKRAISLNLKDPKGLDVFNRLVAKADVVVENFRPDVKAKLGVDYESVKKINPRIVYGSISGFGQDGPYHKRPGFDQIAQGMGGLMSITGAPGEGPMRVGIPVADLTAGLFCAMGILTALLEREVSGEGQWVQTSLLQAQIFMLDFQAARWLMEKDVAQQAGNDHPTSIPTGVFKTSDGYINIATTGGRIWTALLRGARRTRSAEPARIRHRAGALEESKSAQRRDRQIHREEIERDLGQGVQRRRRALRPDLFDRPGLRGCAGPASRHGPACAERREPAYPARRPALHAVAHAEQNGCAAAGIRRADRGRADRIRLRQGRNRGFKTAQGGVTPREWHLIRPPQEAGYSARPMIRSITAIIQN